MFSLVKAKSVKDIKPNPPASMGLGKEVVRAFVKTGSIPILSALHLETLESSAREIGRAASNRHS